MYLVYGNTGDIPDRREIEVRNQGATINQEGRNPQVLIVVEDLRLFFTR